MSRTLLVASLHGTQRAELLFFVLLNLLTAAVTVFFACWMSCRPLAPPLTCLHKRDKPTLTIDFSLFFVCVKMSIVWLSISVLPRQHWPHRWFDSLFPPNFPPSAGWGWTIHRLSPFSFYFIFFLSKTWRMGGYSTCTHAVIVQTFVGRLDRLRPES
jgi:hypothetical protein